MKRGLCFVAVMVIALLLLAACGQTEKGKRVDIAEYGSIAIPDDWSSSNVDGFICFEDRDSAKVLVQYRSGEEINGYFANIKTITLLQDENFSNSAGITKYKVEYQDGSSEELFAVCFSGDNYKSTEFLCINTFVTEDILREIAKSYSIYK